MLALAVPQIPIFLEIEPEFRACSYGLPHCKRRSSGNTPPTVDNFIQPGTRPFTGSPQGQQVWGMTLKGAICYCTKCTL